MPPPGENPHSRQCEECKKRFTPRRPEHRLCGECAYKAKAQGKNFSSFGHESNDLRAKFVAYLDNMRDKGYFEDEDKGEKYLRCDLKIKDADMVAQMLKKSEVTTGQLRQFFTRARGLEHQLDIGKSFKAIKPEIAKMRPLIAAVVGREQKQEQRRRLENLRSFIDVNVEKACASEQAFRKGFISHFECVIAYFTFYKQR